MSANLGWLYWVDYFRDLDYAAMLGNAEIGNAQEAANERTIAAKTRDLIAASVEAEIFTDNLLGNAHFLATTHYPGLILGTGYSHELPNIKNQPILGLHFDYTTGLPVIPGSSVKGALRTAFETPGYIVELLEELNLPGWSESEIKELEKAIFGSDSNNEIHPGQDIFFDAIIVDKRGPILGDDYITPHGDGITEEPNPLRFIKIMPEVTFRFDFELHDTEIAGKTLMAKKKRELFMKIVEDLGMGAKTNVGYGYFINIKAYRSEEEMRREREVSIEKAFCEAKENRDLEALKRFQREHPDYKPDETAQIIKEIEEAKEAEEIEKKWRAIDKTKKDHISSFIDKYATEPKAKKFIEEAKKFMVSKSAQSSPMDFSAITSITDYKKLENFLKKVPQSTEMELDEEKKEMVEQALRQLKKVPKKSKFNFTLFNRLLGKERANAIAKEIGIK